MKGSYDQLNHYTRTWISLLLNDGKSYREIARTIGIHHSTISREIKRYGSVENGEIIYHPILAQKQRNASRSLTHAPKIERIPNLCIYIEKKLALGWSPDAISGDLKRNHPDMYVSHEAIYKYIYEFKREWIKLLPRGKDRRARRKNQYESRVKTKIPDRNSIENRPEAANDRSEFGHFEADCIVSRKSKAALLVITERKTRKVKIVWLHRKTSKVVKKAIVKALRQYKDAVKTITYDNGTENVLHMKVNKALNCKSYFCNPYHSWEKGSVEHANGMIRRYVKKSMDIADFSEKQIRKIQNRINNIPRKVLSYRTAQEYFNQQWCSYG